MNKETELIASLLAKGTPEERAAYNRVATAHNRTIDATSQIDVDNVTYELGQSVNRLDVITDYFDDVETLITAYDKHPDNSMAAFLGCEVIQRWERFKTMVFDARKGVKDQIKALEEA